MAPLNSKAAPFIPKPKLLKDWYNMKEIMEKIRQKNMFWVTNPNNTKSLLPQIRRMIRGTLKKAYRRLKRNKHGRLGLELIQVRDWTTILPPPNSTIDTMLEMHIFLADIFTYTSESTPESTDFLNKASSLRTMEDFKLLFFHPLMQSKEEKFYFPIKAFGYLSSQIIMGGMAWKDFYSQSAPRFTSNPSGVEGSILVWNSSPRTITFMDGSKKLVAGFTELESIRIWDSKQYSVQISGNRYSAEELRYLRNAKTHYNEEMEKIYQKTLHVEDIEMVFDTVFPNAALNVFQFFWKTCTEIDFEGHFEITDLVEDLF